MFRKVLIANRGEIALRIIRACRSLGVRSVAVYSEADAQSPHLRHADETICIGPSPAAGSYLNQDAILEAARQTEAQAVHPGFGFLSENALFATRCAHQGLTFIGPSPEAIRQMGDKATARRTMKAAGLPVMPGSRDILTDVQQAAAMAEEVGYPVLLKATAGGGGRGMRRVDSPAGLAGAFEDASREAEKAFSNAGLYMEKYIIGGRHIEFQVLADRWGHAIHLGERECSVQRNHQKLLEEAPAWGLSEELRQSVGDKVVRAVQAIGYEGAGTIEFLMDASGYLYFMEMNTRIQVEHPVTELVTGVDLVAWQIRIAAGQPLTVQQKDIRMQGHAIEIRINAEDAFAGFRPSPGLVTRFDVPADGDRGPVRMDSHVEAPYRIPPNYDSMVGKLLVHAADRVSAMDGLVAAIDRSVIEGVQTTLPFHRALLQHPAFRNGPYTTALLQEHPELLSRPSEPD